VRNEKPRGSEPLRAFSNRIGALEMNDSSTVTECFSSIKHGIERRLDANGWRWSSRDSLLLDWCLLNMEADYE
jgi:hypothetical protein